VFVLGDLDVEVEAGGGVGRMAGRFDLDVGLKARLIAAGELAGRGVGDVGSEDTSFLPGVVVMEAEDVVGFTLGGKGEEGARREVGGAFFASIDVGEDGGGFAALGVVGVVGGDAPESELLVKDR